MQAATYDKALSFYNKGNYKKAGRMIDRLLKNKAGHAGAYFLKGRIAYKERHDLEGAEKYINEAISLSPDNPDYYLDLAQVLIDDKQIEKAISCLQHCLDLQPDNYNAQALMANLLRFQGRYSPAYDIYQWLKSINKLGPIGHLYIIDCLQNIGKVDYSATVDNDVLGFLRQSTLEHNQYSWMICHLINNKYGLDNPAQTIDIHQFAQDELIIRALKQINIRDFPLEQLIIEIRRELLISCLEHGALEKQWQDLVIAIAEQSLNNEYVFLCKDDEREMLQALQGFIGLLLNQASVDIVPLSCAVIVLAMYQPVYDLECAEKLLQIPGSAWPANVQSLVQRCLHDIDDEVQRAATIPALTNIRDTTSLAVQAQYEANPYPRWIQLTYVEQQLSLRNLIAMESTSRDKLPAFLDEPSLNILVAGCGSGRQPLQLAKMFKNTNILAVDLSRRSLAYAQRMAEHFQIGNVKFMHADILELERLTEKFHLILSTGVLHHMQDPMAGWEVLRGLLVEDGLMKIGLYSELARQPIVRIRHHIETNQIGSSPEDIKLLRHQILLGQFGEEIKTKLEGLSDLHALSACRDLLFHVQEHRFSISRLQQALESLDLKFLGFNLTHVQHYRNYQARFPRDEALTDLNSWALYEQQNPDMFIAMYKFWCQATSK